MTWEEVRDYTFSLKQRTEAFQNVSVCMFLK